MLELLLVVALLALLAGAVVRGRAPVPAGVKVQAAAREIAAGLRHARARAIAANRPVGVTFDLAARQWQSEGEAPRALPEGVELSLLTAREEATLGSPLAAASPGGARGAGRIRFDGDGSASGGRVGVTAGNNRYWVGVDWLTGKVTLLADPG